MKQIIVTDRIRQLIDFELFPETADIEMYMAFSNEDALNIHRKKKADLIITELYGSGINAVEFCSLIREDRDLQRVSVIVCCRSNDVELRESARCRANAVITLPIQRPLLVHHVQQLLNIPRRGDYRINFSARCARHSLLLPFDCKSENISTTGMLIASSAELIRGDRLNCELVLPPAVIFETQAEVVRSIKNKPGTGPNFYGVRFSRLEPGARHAIEILVQKNAPSGHPGTR